MAPMALSAELLMDPEPNELPTAGTGLLRPPQDSTGEMAFLDPRSPDSVAKLRSAAEKAVDQLVATRRPPAVLVATAWHPAQVVHTFENLELYREVAAAADCKVVQIGRARNGGLEDLLFITYDEELSDEEYIECIDAVLVAREPVQPVQASALAPRREDAP